MLTIFNSLSRQKEKFKPLTPGVVGLYVCGMTVYDYCHIGHARVMVTFDVVARHLRQLGYQVNYVRNITDVDDKIINRANELGVSIAEITEKFIAAMHEDASALHVLPPNSEPRATEYIEKMIALIQRLLANDFAYISASGDVCYSVAKCADYGKLSRKDLDGLRAGARVAVSEGKRDPLDFVLWKLVKPGEPCWASPWGDGRPGWHIECSAMAMDCLGDTFDLHGGGADLQFPHHENEIAQSCAVSGKEFVKTWLHVGFVQVDSEKMSKSLGNFFTIREVLAKYDPEVIRYFMLSSHYRSPLNYSDDALNNAKSALERVYLSLRGLPPAQPRAADQNYRERFQLAMNDDFNTPEALAVIFDLVREINGQREVNEQVAASQATLLQELAAVLGILQQDPEVFLQGGEQGDTAKIEALIRARDEARGRKDWVKADAVRDELTRMGVILEDSTGQTTWRKG